MVALAVAYPFHRRRWTTASELVVAGDYFTTDVANLVHVDPPQVRRVAHPPTLADVRRVWA